MATRKKPLAKAQPELPLDVEPRVPVMGEKVQRPGSDTIYEITFVGFEAKYVHIGIPRTVFEHRNVDPATLIYLDQPQTRTKPAPPPPRDTTAIREHIENIHHSAMESLSGEIAILKKYLKSERVPEDILAELDELCEDTEKRWHAALERINQMLK